MRELVPEHFTDVIERIGMNRRQREEDEADVRIGYARGVLRVRSALWRERAHFSGRSRDANMNLSEHLLPEPNREFGSDLDGVANERLDPLARRGRVGEVDPARVTRVERRRDRGKLELGSPRL